MLGTHLRFYVHEDHRHHGILLYEWLLEFATKTGLPGGLALRASAGFGRHGVLHENHFFELAGTLPVVLEFIASDADIQRFLDALAAEKLALFYSRQAVEFGVLNGGA
jgi:PII-like signaling protein